jgi:hypothetical protein
MTNPAIKGRKILNVRGVEIDAPFYEIHGNTVWGATAMMISELLMVIDEI